MASLRAFLQSEPGNLVRDRPSVKLPAHPPGTRAAPSSLQFADLSLTIATAWFHLGVRKFFALSSAPQCDLKHG